MICDHLKDIEREVVESGASETFRGKAWTRNCREWVYYDCYIDRPSLRSRLSIDECVQDHDHLGTHDGQESGFVCSQCQDAIMGVHETNMKPSTIVVK